MINPDHLPDAPDKSGRLCLKKGNFDLFWMFQAATCGYHVWSWPTRSCLEVGTSTMPSWPLWMVIGTSATFLVMTSTAQQVCTVADISPLSISSCLSSPPTSGSTARSSSWQRCVGDMSSPQLGQGSVLLFSLVGDTASKDWEDVSRNFSGELGACLCDFPVWIFKPFLVLKALAHWSHLNVSVSRAYWLVSKSTWFSSETGAVAFFLPRNSGENTSIWFWPLWPLLLIWTLFILTSFNFELYDLFKF